MIMQEVRSTRTLPNIRRHRRMDRRRARKFSKMAMDFLGDMLFDDNVLANPDYWWNKEMTGRHFLLLFAVGVIVFTVAAAVAFFA